MRNSGTASEKCAGGHGKAGSADESKKEGVRAEGNGCLGEEWGEEDEEEGKGEEGARVEGWFSFRDGEANSRRVYFDSPNFPTDRNIPDDPNNPNNLGTRNIYNTRNICNTCNTHNNPNTMKNLDNPNNPIHPDIRLHKG